MAAVVLSRNLFFHDARHGVDSKSSQEKERVYELMVTNLYASIVKLRQKEIHETDLIYLPSS